MKRALTGGGIAIISTFCGVFSAGFVDYLDSVRQKQAGDTWGVGDGLFVSRLRLSAGLRD